MVQYIYLALAVLAIIGIAIGATGIVLIRKGRRAAREAGLEALEAAGGTPLEPPPDAVSEESRPRPRKSD